MRELSSLVIPLSRQEVIYQIEALSTSGGVCGIEASMSVV